MIWEEKVMGMIKIFVRSLIRQARKNPGVVFLLLLGLTVSCFCLSVAQGEAMREFDVISGWNDYATLTVDMGGEALRDMPKFAEWLDETYGERLANVLYLTRDQSDVIYIGWQGTQVSRWFPDATGRFFTEEEAYAPVIYLSDKDGDLDARTFELGGRELTIVGRGSAMPFYFRRGISQKSDVDIMPEGTKGVVRILPYGLFFQFFRPVQILVHFDTLERREAMEIRENIEAELPWANVYLPNHDPGPMLARKALKGAREGMILCLIAMVTVVELMLQWLGFLKKELFTYHLCGMTYGCSMVIVYGQWLLMLTFAAVLGAGIHRLCLPVMDIFKAGVMPRLWVYILLVWTLYLLLALCSLPKVRRTIKLSERGEGT